MANVTCRDAILDMTVEKDAHVFCLLDSFLPPKGGADLKYVIADGEKDCHGFAALTAVSMAALVTISRPVTRSDLVPRTMNEFVPW